MKNLKHLPKKVVTTWHAFAKKYPRRSRTVIVLAIAFIGTSALLISHAATFSISLEPENGTNSGTTTLTDSTASNGKAVKFGATTTTPPTGNFTINAGKIYDPGGKEFIPIGANVNGPNSWWSAPTAGKASIAHDRWHWTAVRVNTCLSGGCPDAGAVWTTNNDLNAIVNDYTAQKIVVMIAIHNYTGSIPTGTDLTNVTNFWKTTATTYKNNPYVWFNILNEPSGDPAIPEWTSVHSSIATAIRGTGAQNMIVADASNWGQDFPNGWTCPSTYNASSQSAVLTNGANLASQFSPMMFSIHIYGWWGGTTCPDATRDSYVDSYVSQARQKGLAIMVGEFQGMSNTSNEPSYQAGQSKSADAFFRRAPDNHLGLFWWHGNAGSTPTSGLLSNDSDWYNINSGATNLSAYGTKLRNYALSVNP